MRYHLVGVLLFVLLTAIIFSATNIPSGTEARPIPQVKHTIERIWNGTSAKRIAISGDYLYLLNGSNEVIMFEKEQEMAVFDTPQSFFGIAAINRTLFYPQDHFDDSKIFAVSFENFSNPNIISNISYFSTGPLSSIMSYGHYVYVACYEWRFPIFDFSNITNPRKVGYVPLSTWHSYRIYRVSNYGLFIGDQAKGLYDLSTDPINPLLIWRFIDFSQGISVDVKGNFAASSQFFVMNYNTWEYETKISEEMFYIIPRENTTAIATPYNITYSFEEGYEHLALIYDNILVASGANNTISIFEITEDQDLEFLSKISLGEQGSVEDLYLVENTTIFYIADGSNGLLKLNLTLEFVDLPGNTTSTSSFTTALDTSTETSGGLIPSFTALTLIVPLSVLTVRRRFVVRK